MKNERRFIMKTLRYLLMMTTVLSVLSLSAQTPQYGKMYTPKNDNAIYSTVQAQMPEAQMGSVGSDFMKTGSTLPMAATDGTTFGETEATQSAGHPGSIRRRPPDWEDPYKDPLGDAAIPLALCALAYLIVRVVRKRTRV